MNRFDYLECALWMKGRPTPEKIFALHRRFFERGSPLVIELSR